jgi:hypothetical protein
MPGPATSEAEVTNISQHGFRLLVDARELFLPFDDFPWFKSAPVEAIIRFERPAPTHLYWPALDVDGIAHARLFDQRGFSRRTANRSACERRLDAVVAELVSAAM